ncbi:MAG: hypothetical protein GTO30_03375 [Acidobacteria bacterium]|nr:hypothetical protein [Acidobacteriota bacterium]NIQ84441.1 hypothetical protein [Acidobacteriota bacterium]
MTHRYAIEFHGVAYVDAENVAEAHRIAHERVRVIGRCGGRYRKKHVRDSLRYGVDIVPITFELPRRVDK